MLLEVFVFYMDDVVVDIVKCLDVGIGLVNMVCYYFLVGLVKLYNLVSFVYCYIVEVK